MDIKTAACFVKSHGQIAKHGAFQCGQLDSDCIVPCFCLIMNGEKIKMTKGISWETFATLRE